jgi:hypothetical protein
MASSLTLMQDVGEQIPERRGRRTARACREIEPLEPERRLFPGRRAAPDCVVPAPPLRVGERLVRLGDLSEPQRRRPVPRVEVRMMSSGKAPVRTLDVPDQRIGLHTENDVEVHVNLKILGISRM